VSANILKFDDSAHRAADEVLPWLVNGTLQDDELAAVEQHVRECARCQREVELLRQVRSACAAEAPRFDVTPSYHRMRARIGAGSRVGALGDRVRRLLRPWWRAPGWARWAIAAEFAAIISLVVWLAPPSGGEPEAAYQTLGAPASPFAPAGSIAVVFRPEVTDDELRRIVERAGANVIDGPTESNAYVLVVPAGHREAILAALRADPGVALAQPLTTGRDR